MNPDPRPGPVPAKVRHLAARLGVRVAAWLYQRGAKGGHTGVWELVCGGVRGSYVPLTGWLWAPGVSRQRVANGAVAVRLVAEAARRRTQGRAA